MIPIIQTKLSVHQVPERNISRKALFKRMEKGLTGKLTLITGGAGWGKSLLAAGFLKQSRIPDPTWLSLDANDADPLVFLSYLIEGIGANHPEVRDRLSNLIRSDQIREQWLPVISSLINVTLQLSPKSVVLVLDDYHTLDQNPEINKLVFHWLRYSPPNCHLLLISRAKPDIPISKFRIDGEVLEIDTNDLRFSTSEIRSFLGELYQIDLGAQDLDILEKYTDGWAMSLKMVGEALSQQPKDKRSTMLEALGTSSIPVIQYFNEEVFSQLPEALREFLLKTSILRRFNAVLCNALPDISDASALIDAAQKRELFLIPLDEKGEWYRYHNLFRRFLIEKLQQEKSREAFLELNRTAADYHLQRRDWAEVTHYLVAAEAFHAAADSIENIVVQHFGYPLKQSIVQWLNQIPDAIIETNAGLLFAKGWVYHYDGFHLQADTYLVKAREVAIRQKKAEIISRATALLLFLRFNIGQYDDVERIYMENVPLQLPESIHTINAMSTMAATYMHTNRPDKARVIWEELQGRVAGLPEQSHLPSFLYRIGIEYYHPLGQFADAIKYLTNGMKNCHQRGFVWVYCAYGIAMVLVKNEMGQFQEASQAIAELTDFLMRVKDYASINIANSIGCLNAMDKGDLEEAQHYYQQIAETPFLSKQGFIVHCSHALMALKKGDRNRFHAEARHAIDQVEKSGYFLYHYLAATWLVAGYISIGDCRTAVDLLENCLKRIEKIDAFYIKARCHLLLASMQQTLNKPALSEYHFDQAIHIADAMHYDFLFTHRERPHALKLLPMALERKSNLPFLAQLLPRQGRNVGNMVYGFLNHPDPALRIFSIKTLTQMEFRDAEKDIANLTRDDNPEVQKAAFESLVKIKSFSPLPLNVQILGRFRLFQDKREILAKAWRLKTAKLLFKYLLLHLNQEISSEKLVDIFYRDADAEDAKQRLHKAASALRAALEPGISAKRESGYLKASAGYYQLVLPDHSTVDAFEFGRICHQAENAEYQGKTRLSQSLYKSALNLYQSDLLEENAYEDWIDPFRARYTNLFLKALMKTAQLHFQLFEYDQSIEPLQRLLAKDAWHEDAWLLLMKCHLALGNKSKAIQAFKQCATLLRNELDIGPGKALTDLFRSIK